MLGLRWLKKDQPKRYLLEDASDILYRREMGIETGTYLAPHWVYNKKLKRNIAQWDKVINVGKNIELLCVRLGERGYRG